MPIFALLIAIKNQKNKNALIILKQYELSSYSYTIRSQLKGLYNFTVRQLLEVLPSMTRHTIQHDQNVSCHAQIDKQPIAAFAFADKKYPRRLIFTFLRNVLEVFKEKNQQKWKQYDSDLNICNKQISELFKQWQNPAKVDKLTNALQQSQLTKIQLHQSLKKLLSKQGDIDELLNRSKDLSAAAKSIFINSQKMQKGKCCNIM